ncbi:C-type lectin domain family 2 member A-like [Carettochelys insculpta]|uniref:C-type lectin domain family 2 member A-like n=1 Tax=Carettochelys insculpta TaxID=44489 RepID=UPI003EBA6D7C
MENGFHATERMEPHRSSQETHVNISRESGESSTIHPTGWLSALKAWAPHMAVLSLALNGIFIIILIAVSAKPCELCPAGAACPDGWARYLGKCYYFSETEANWNDSQRHCSAHDASLALIDTTQEMDFLVRHKGSSNHWVGLWRELGQSWKWASGTEFNNWFPIVGEGHCTFLSTHRVGSTPCSGEGPWICNKPVREPAGRANSL